MSKGNIEQFSGTGLAVGVAVGVCVGLAMDSVSLSLIWKKKSE